MNQITLLSQDTIDKIAAGEVVERPASVVKELVENAVDAGANSVTVEIKDGGISLIRITDNGCGIPKEEVRAAFMRHATSKIRTVEDLLTAGTLGFRGEALSSIAAVCQVEMITKTPGSLFGVRYVIEGGVETALEEIGAPEGTTFLVRNLFYHTPARRKFLKSAATEAGYIGDLMERLALSHPNIAFKFINNRDTKLHTSGNGKLKDIIYGVYGREIAANIVWIDAGTGPIHISGFIGKPLISRGNRNYENYFVNGRYVRSAIIARAIEDAYKAFLMNHRYPLTVLSLQIDTDQVDVNVHPTKMEVRFASQSEVYDQVYQAVRDGLMQRELIPEFTIDKDRLEPLRSAEAPKQAKASAQSMAHAADAQRQPENKLENKPESKSENKPADESENKPENKQENKSVNKPEDKSGSSAHYRYPEPFEKVRSRLLAEASGPYEAKYPGHPSHYAMPERRTGVMKPVTGTVTNAGVQEQQADAGDAQPNAAGSTPNSAQEEHREQARASVQMELFDDKLLSGENVKHHKLVGQIFETYWIVEFQDKMYIIDQHAAHEKVLYERFMKNLAEKKQTSQMITPPLIISLSIQEEEMLKKHMDRFTETGFEIEPFGGREYSIRAVPGNLYGIADRTLFLELLDGLTDVSEKASQQAVCERIASMSCKAAVKGGHRLQTAEVDALIGELLTLENPYNCPHGRPTIIAMSKYDLEKKFKRIL